MPAVWYRVRQFGRALTARVSLEERALVARVLPAPAAALFYHMPRQDQRHGLDVLYGLQARGEDAPELLAAALLHDIAKAEGVRIWHRVVAVLLQALCPRWFHHLASPDPRTWGYPFWLQLHHPQRGAELAEAAGCAAATVELVRYHQEAEEASLPLPLNRWLAALQAVDDEY